MRKLFITSALFTAIAVLAMGCLKDKGFDDKEYGINDPDTQPPGVGFPLATKVQTYGLNVSASPQAVNDLVYVNLESGNPAPADVHVTLTDNTSALVAAHNQANNLTGNNAVLVLPSSLYTFANSIVIPAGGRNAQIPINVSNTTALDPNRSYAVGVTISSVDGGYLIASNLKNLLIVFNIKNRLDGIYEVTGAALRAGDAVLTGSVGTYETTFATSGANSVQWIGPVYWGGQASQLPGGYEPNVTVDPNSNLITSVTSSTGIYMTNPIVRTDIIGTTQRYDPVTKTLYFEFSYGGGPTSRLFSLVARYLRPR